MCARFFAETAEHRFDPAPRPSHIGVPPCTRNLPTPIRGLVVAPFPTPHRFPQETAAAGAQRLPAKRRLRARPFRAPRRRGTGGPRHSLVAMVHPGGVVRVEHVGATLCRWLRRAREVPSGAGQGGLARCADAAGLPTRCGGETEGDELSGPACGLTDPTRNESKRAHWARMRRALRAALQRERARAHAELAKGWAHGRWC